MHALPPLPPEVVGLVHGPIGTIAHVELLLALRAADGDPCTLASVAAAAHVASLDRTRTMLRGMEAAGIVARVNDDSWRYAPRDVATRRAVDGLRAAYDQRPVSLVRTLYERPSTPLRTFADAFRFRRER